MLNKPNWVWRIAKWNNEWINQSSNQSYRYTIPITPKALKPCGTIWRLHLKPRLTKTRLIRKLNAFLQDPMKQKEFPRRARTETPHEDFAENKIAWKVETSPKRAYRGPGIWLIRTAIFGFNWTWLLAKTCRLHTNKFTQQNLSAQWLSGNACLGALECPNTWSSE